MPPDGPPDEEDGDREGADRLRLAMGFEQQPTKPEIVDQASDVLRPLLRDPTRASSTAAEIVAVMEAHRGPMPPPRMLADYNEIVPGAAREILEMAKAEQRHRHKMESLETSYPFLALGLGFSALAACIGGAIFLAYRGVRSDICLALLGAPLLAAISWLINARINRPAPPPAQMRTGEKTQTLTRDPA